MKTKNMRKKALLSSVAMLLVAVVALSGATYAWFTANTDATVSPIQLSTERQSSLVLSSNSLSDENPTFTSSLNVNWNQTLTPVSGSVGANGALSFKKAVANQEALTGDESSTPVSSIEAGATTDYLQRTILVKSSVKSQVILKAIDGAGALEDALRVAVKIGNNTVVYAPGNDGGTYNEETQVSTPNTTYVVAGNAVSGLSGVTYNTLYNATSDITVGESPNQKTIGISPCTIGVLGKTQIATNLTANTATEMQITIWLEGNDSDCTNTMAGVTIGGLVEGVLTGVKLTFTSVEVA